MLPSTRWNCMSIAIEPNLDAELDAPPTRAVPAGEPLWTRRLFLFIALAVAAAYGFAVFSWFVPAPGRPGIDENAYL